MQLLTNIYVNTERLFLFLFKKKLTVMGIIGHTQGVSKAANPQIKPFRKMLQRDESYLFSVPPALSSSTTGAQSISLSTLVVATTIV